MEEIRTHPDKKKADRIRIGKLASILSILLNLLLFGGKLLAGLLSGTISIVADAFNNLSDATASIVSFVGFRLSAQPPDADHPFGHARYEYISGMLVAALILVMGYELVKSSAEKIFSPTESTLSALTVAILAASIAVKFGMFLMNRYFASKIDSTVLKTTALDSRNDALITSAVLASAAIEHFSGLQIDGFTGFAVALFILYSGVKLIKETIDPLLGTGGKTEIRNGIANIVRLHPKVLGFHDLLIHDYGPEQCFATIHLEIDQHESSVACHELIDHIERRCMKLLGVHLVAHYDPVITDDPELSRLRESAENALFRIDESLSLHDFRVVQKDNHIRLVFDVPLPDRLRNQKEEIRRFITDEICKDEGAQLDIRITFDTQMEE
ncbi:MAG: cation transporter [Clostridiales bacterium]|nr:cation transporter [Clostridiales bacterium]